MTGLVVLVIVVALVVWFYTRETNKERKIWNGGSCIRCGGPWKIIRTETDSESNTNYLCGCKCRVGTWFMFLKLK
jgi:hypothetical protein